MSTDPVVAAAETFLRGQRIEHLAELVRSCSDDIYTELAAIERRHPSAMVQHSRQVTERISTLCDLLCETAGVIKAEGGAA